MNGFPFVANAVATLVISGTAGTFFTVIFLVAAVATPFLTTVADRDYILQRATGGGPLDRNSARDYDLTEKATAGYLMADFEGELFGKPFKANAGVRVINTKFSVKTLQQSGTTAAPVFTPVTDKNSYTNTLPSANIVFNVTNDFLVRLAASKTMNKRELRSWHHRYSSIRPIARQREAMLR